MQFNLTNRKNSVCYHCIDHTGTCRATCPHGQAEQLRNEADRQQRVLEAMAEYDSARQVNGIAHERKVWG